MLTAEFRERIRAVLIHNLHGGNLTQQGLHTFQTYLGAMLVLREQGLVNEAACQRVAEAVRDDLALSQYRSPEQRKRVLAAYLLDRAQLH